MFLLLCLLSEILEATSEPSQLLPKLGPHSNQLRHLHLLFRHGDRSPFVPNENILQDFWKIWPQGLEQLTDVGVEQQFLLGRWLRKEYTDFVPSNYNRSYYYMRSTDFDRTLMSAMANIAGFFNGSNSPLSKYDIRWSPVPVHTTSVNRDSLLGIANCPKLKLLWDSQLNSKESVNYQKSHGKLFDLLSNESGFRVNRTNLWQIADLLICMKAHNITLPKWCTDEVWSEIMEVDLYYWVKMFATNREMIQLEIGGYLYQFVSHINSLITTGKSKMFKQLSTEHIMAYSAHDSDVTHILTSFGVYDQKKIGYASLVALELIGPAPPAPVSQYRLKLRYKKGWTDSEAAYLQLPACPNEPADKGCPWELVVKQIQPYILDPSQYDDLCATQHFPISTSVMGYIAIGFGLALLVMLIVFLIYLCLRQRPTH